MYLIAHTTHANIFMANFEPKHIYPYIKEITLLYLRYTDSIFMIWKGTKVELMTFIKELSEKHNTIQFDFQISPRKLHFLTLCYTKTKITTFKQLYIANLKINKHSYTLNQNTQDP